MDISVLWVSVGITRETHHAETFMASNKIIRGYNHGEQLPSTVLEDVSKAGDLQ